MNITSLLSLSAALTCLATGQVSSQTAHDAVVSEGTDAATRADRILGLAPSDALFVFYTEDLTRLLTHPVLAELPPPRNAISSLAESWGNTFRGPTMLALSGSPILPMTWRFTFAAEVAPSGEAFFRSLETDLLPVWRRVGAVPTEARFWRDDGVGRFQLPTTMPVTMNVAHADGVVLASSMPGIVEAWLDGEEIGPAFVSGDDFARLRGETTGSVAALAYANLRPLLPLAIEALNANLPNLYGALQLERVEFVGVVSITPPAPGDSAKVVRKPSARRSAVASEPPRAVVRRLAIGMRELVPGLWHAVASHAQPSTLATFFPPDTALLFVGSMESAAVVAEDLTAFANAIDPVIAQEYATERAEFREQIGLDLQGEFLANFVGQWAVGFSSFPDGAALLAVRLANPTVFRAHMLRLRVAFELDTRTTTYRRVAVQHAMRKIGPFSYAVAGDVLLVSPSAAVVFSAIDAYFTGNGLAEAERFEAIRTRAPDAVAGLAYVDLAQLVEAAEQAGEVDDFEALLEPLRAQQSVAVAVVPHDRLIAIELLTAKDEPGLVLDMIGATLIPSLAAARVQAKRAVSLSRIKQILVACRVHEADNKGEWPDSLAKLARSGILGTPAEAGKIMSDPYTGDKPTPGRPYYLYRPVLDINDVKHPADEIAVSEPALHEGGLAVGFVDGHVEWVTSPQAEDLLGLMKSAQ